MKKIALLAVAALGLAVLPGCGLILLPCYVCAACAGAGGGGPSVATDEARELAELGPTLQTRALTSAVAH